LLSQSTSVQKLFAAVFSLYHNNGAYLEQTHQQTRRCVHVQERRERRVYSPGHCGKVVSVVHTGPKQFATGSSIIHTYQDATAEIVEFEDEDCCTLRGATGPYATGLLYYADTMGLS